MPGLLSLESPSTNLWCLEDVTEKPLAVCITPVALGPDVQRATDRREVVRHQLPLLHGHPVAKGVLPNGLRQVELQVVQRVNEHVLHVQVRERGVELLLVGWVEQEIGGSSTRPLLLGGGARVLAQDEEDRALNVVLLLRLEGDTASRSFARRRCSREVPIVRRGVGVVAHRLVVQECVRLELSRHGRPVHVAHIIALEANGDAVPVGSGQA